MVFAMACAFLCAQGIAMSEPEATVPPLRHILDIAIAVSPDEMVDSGDVTLTFSVENNTEHSANNLYMESLDGHYSESLGQVSPGEKLVYTRTYSVSQEELDAGKLTFRISHDDIITSGGEPVVYTLEALVSRMEAAPELEFTRQLSSRSVTAGSQVMLTYRVRNTGNVLLSDIRVKDKLGSFTAMAEELEPGEAKVFSGRVAVDDAVVSEASVTYRAPSVSDDDMTIELDGVEIEIIEPELVTALTLDRLTAKVGDTVNGVITLGAKGCDFTDVCVIDDVFNSVIADTIELRDDETLTVTCSWPVRGNSDYRVRLEGTAADGKRMVAYSNTASLELTGEFEYSELSVSANAQTPEINREGRVRINVSIKNAGNSAARDVVLSEAGMGEIRRLDFVPAGEPTMLSVLMDVQEDAEFVFTAAYTGADGQTVAVMSEPVSIRITDDGAEPVDDGDTDKYGVYEINNERTYYWMMGIGGAVLLVLVILLIVSHDRERRERKMRKEIGKMRAAKHARGENVGRRGEK